MKIYSMRATFGKLENQTLSFREGLNVIHAPNEWGKSTWCAFLVAMLYGIDTRERTKQGSLADKERYAPWSGSPMCGQMELCWNGKDITIERSTVGRTVFGEFRAYETKTGLPVPELNGANCGQLLLGVEKSVFTRAGFIRLSDLPVTNDDALRRRLNALVTTGDESGAGDTMAQKLKDLKNRCRHNKTGLLPQLEAQRTAVLQTLERLRDLKKQTAQLTQRRDEVNRQLALLENHRDSLAYAVSQSDARQVEAAETAFAQADQAYQRLLIQCQSLPDRATAEENILQLEQLQLDREELLELPLPPAPEKPEAPEPFEGMTPGQAAEQAQKDLADHRLLSKRHFPAFLVLAILTLGFSVWVLSKDWRIFVPMLLLGLVLIFAHFRNLHQQKTCLRELEDQYMGIPAGLWPVLAEDYAAQMAEYTEAEAAHKTRLENYAARKEALEENIAFVTGGVTITESLDGWRETLALHASLETARYERSRAREHADALAAMAKTAQAPTGEDPLTHTMDMTVALLAQHNAEHRQLEMQLGNLQGQMEALGQEAALEQQLAKLQARIDRLEEIYAAAALALDTLAEASAGLQRRFAPRISGRAQALFSQMTGGSYDRLLLDEELGIQTARQDQVNLRSALWCSDGTADQQYLALRLAVAGELTPQAPLVLDDALVRFDDTRLAQAMGILKEEAKTRQVIIFTCQGREAEYL